MTGQHGQTDRRSIVKRFARSRDERGQVLVIVAGGLIGLLSIAAFVLEGGTMILNRRDGQNAADLAALAGARIVGQNYTQSAKTQHDVFTAIRASLDINDCQASSGTPCAPDPHFVTFTNDQPVDLGPIADTGAAIPAGAVGVRVGVTREPGAVVGRIIGFDHWTVSVEATASVASPDTWGDGIMLPIAVCGWDSTAAPNDCAQASNNPAPGNFIDFKAGQIYDLTDGKDAPGGFGWISWDGSNAANALSDAICNPDNPPFSLDSPYDDPGAPINNVFGTHSGDGETWFAIDPGKSNKASMRACLDGWIASGTTVLVPIYDQVIGNGNKAQYHITGVAAFILVSREQPAVDNIQGIFVGYYDGADVPGGLGSTPPTPADTTVYIRLVK